MFMKLNGYITGLRRLPCISHVVYGADVSTRNGWPDDCCAESCSGWTPTIGSRCKPKEYP